MHSNDILNKYPIKFLIIIPNSVIASSKIINESGGRHVKERIRVSVGVAYGSDVDLVKKVLLDIAASAEHLSREPAPRVRFRRLGDSALEFELLGWVGEPVLRGRALDELNTMVYKEFSEKGIQIPFPQRDVHIKKDL